MAIAAIVVYDDVCGANSDGCVTGAVLQTAARGRTRKVEPAQEGRKPKARTISLFFGKLMKNSLNKGWRRFFECLLFRDNLSIFYEDFLDPIDFPFLVKLNGGFDIDVLVFGLIVRAFGI